MSRGALVLCSCHRIAEAVGLLALPRYSSESRRSVCEVQMLEEGILLGGALQGYSHSQGPLTCFVVPKTCAEFVIEEDSNA